MIRFFVLLLPLLAVGACKGLFLDAGNAYPCDFSRGPGARDAACIGGDVCGTNNVCQKYIYDGPRFEGPATVPSYGPDSGEGEVIHPLVVNAPITFVTQVMSGTGRNLFVTTGDGGSFELTFDGKIVGTAIDFPRAPATINTPAVARQPYDPGLGRTDVLTQWASGELSIGTLGASGPSSVVHTGVTGLSPAFSPVGYRVVPGPLFTGVPLAWTASDIGFVQNGVVPHYVPALDAGPFQDVAAVSSFVLAMTHDELVLVDLSAGTVSTPADFVPLTPPSLNADRLRTDRQGRIVAAIRRNALGDVLSTFLLTEETTGLVFTRAWSDCRPCASAIQHVEVFAPSVATGAPVVEVICQGPLGGFDSGRVVGSVALTQTQQCVTEPLTLPLPAARLAHTDGGLVQWDGQTGIILGGARGEVWTGDTLSKLLPLYLDRVPRDVTSVPLPDGEFPLAVITNDFLAVQQTPTLAGPRVSANGFRRFDTGKFADQGHLLAFVRGSGGWVMSASGELGQVAVTDAGLEVALGPVLVSAAGDPIRDSMGGEGFFTADGGTALFIAADDSVYFVTDPANPIQALGEPLTPDLTPEPSVPIRSLALERTPLGTDGIGRARGYLVTSRNVYSWQLAGTPARWSSTALVLSGGDPVAVWFDQVRSALGRVGYSDGQVYTLPGGNELVEPLPANDAGLPPQVLDYENLGGWPVAYANTGIFIAGWDQGADGKLQNRFPDGGINRPMTWRQVTLPDGSTPWMKAAGPARNGKLFVTTDARFPAVDGGAQLLEPHRLLLFLDDQVVQLATHVRNVNQ